ncbi:metal ABC transporter substrate-binding protein [Gleimia sp. 6138-11-ORH1]|uniref:metal ABC transporter substrate-binding protein n=1 Tax=Gleimia sp. 6138-11-ORH1 TaxID=2973937 RepID=UPI00216729C6|nr:metal ABC transporter substrate-binding protein [Gleimia sp. 6138-11-ORH1]MCS4484843.1 metal ABC transporter substrate-binding protein [Gleimia sp. 6138-11-ORH1]
MAKNKMITAITATVAACALALSACGQTADKTQPTATEKPKVLTTFTVLADMAQNVAGEHLDVQSITEPDAEIHDYQPTPADIKKAEGVKLILNNGMGLERWFEKFVANTEAKTAVLTEGITPIPIAEGEYEGKPNPHAWMSPTAAQTYVDNIVKAFSELDPEHKADYEKNGETYKAKLAAVDTKLKDAINQIPENQRALVTCEGAFSYLARDTGLTEKYLWAVNAEGALTPKRIADLEAFLKDNQVPSVFCESTVGDKMQPIVESTGVNFGGELYVDSLTGPDGDAPTFLDLLTFDAERIAKGLTKTAK